MRKKYGHSAAGQILFRWAGGSGLSEENEGKSEEQVRAEECARTIRTVREGVLWFLRTGLEGAASVQREMVEKRIERVREKEKSVLYKNSGSRAKGAAEYGAGTKAMPVPVPDAVVLGEAEEKRIEAQLSPEQLQLFAEENDSMLRHYEDTLGKVQYVFALLSCSPVLGHGLY